MCMPWSLSPRRHAGAPAGAILVHQGAIGCNFQQFSATQNKKGDPREAAFLVVSLKIYSFCNLPQSTATLNVVPKRGLEPLRLTSLPPQGSASTSSATWAGVLLSAWPAAPWLPAPRPDSWSGRGLPLAVQPGRRYWSQQALPSQPVRQVRSSRQPACWQAHP
jgi:hypothetical protein